MFSRALHAFRAVSVGKSVFRSVPAAGFQSQYNQKSLYPDSNHDSYSSEAPSDNSDDGFTGHIPVDDLQISFSKSSGPGGQHVNKNATKVHVRFHVDSAEWIPDWIKPRLIEGEKNRITKDGWMVVWSQKTRKQMLNQADCLDKIRNLVWRASVKDFEPSPEDIQLMNKRMAQAKRGILREKRQHSLKKKTRSGLKQF